MGEKTFDDAYPIKDGYKRFDPRNTAFSRSFRGDSGAAQRDNAESREEKMVRNVPGYTLVDYSFSGAALTAAQASHSGRGQMNSGFYSWSSLGVAVKPEGVPRWEGTPQEASKILKKAGKYYGASGMEFCETDRRWIYSHTGDGRPIVFEDVEEGYVTEEKAVIPDSHRWTVAITVPMEVEEMMYSPTALNPVSSMGFSRMPVVAGTVAEFIRGLGYHAIPCGNDTALSVPIAIQAGLGHIGRHGRLITWERGPMVRIAKIFTDLPLAPNPPAPRGIIEFCDACMKCAKQCPSGSITEGPRTYEGHSEANNPGALKWYCNADTCLQYWREVGSGCSICFRVCNFTKPEGISHDIVKWFIRNVPQLNRFWTWTDDLMGYGKMKDPRKYWDTPYEPG
ncbi:MAG: reductive dehalogenase [Candidatus Bathyarchaeota archaeon]|nr:MAG: reductive dehalogenase [Candidatus Bathyarchaeota archaeon]